MKTLKLKHGNNIPIIGIGTWQLTGDKCIESIEYALEIGYRHIDTADIYGNHTEVGQAIKRSNIPRSEVFLTSKVWHTNLRKDEVKNSLKRNLDELSLEYIDLYLVHWPNSSIPITETLEAMQELKEEKLIQSYGVSNFTKNHIQQILNNDFEISINQVEFHPSLFQKDLYNFCMQNEIFITAYSPIGQGKDLNIQEIKNIANKIEATPAQVILSWLIQKNIIVIPKASSKNHIEDNLESLNFELGAEDIATIDSLNQDLRIIDPSFGEFQF